MQQVFFQETEYLNSVIDYNHKVETENLCLDIAYGTDKNFLFGCGISIASILKYNEGSRLCFHIFTDYFGDNDRKYFDALALQYKTRIKIYLINGDRLRSLPRESANKQVISSQADSLIKISRIWADFFPANTSNQP
ncbi:hypothetical protein OFO43_17855, partial [Escherichia coli]|nr:hypothetical protein [Escherichia coli]